jgi:hypothetical protein
LQELEGVLIARTINIGGGGGTFVKWENIVGGYSGAG